MCLICFRQCTPNLDSSLRVYESGASLAHFWAPDVNKIRGLRELRSPPWTSLDPFRGQNYRFHHSTAPSFSFYTSPQPAFPSTPPPQTRRTPPTPILQAILTGPGIGRYRKPGCRAARRAECVGVLFDHLLSLVHDPSAQGSWPRTTNPMARHAPHTLFSHSSRFRPSLQAQCYLCPCFSSLLTAPNLAA
jgi:hypothetical protein